MISAWQRGEVKSSDADLDDPTSEVSIAFEQAKLNAARQRREQKEAIKKERSVRRRLREIRQTPPWADKEAIRAVYVEAARMTALTGEPHHVDHDIPLRGKRVSGLHVAANLKVLHWRENLRKAASFAEAP